MADAEAKAKAEKIAAARKRVRWFNNSRSEDRLASARHIELY